MLDNYVQLDVLTVDRQIVITQHFIISAAFKISIKTDKRNKFSYTLLCTTIKDIIETCVMFVKVVF